MSGQLFVYQTLPEQSIRLLSLVDRGTQGIALRLTTHLISEAPAYNALSYVWGSGLNPHNVQILDQHGQDAGALEIQYNLFQALPVLKAATDKPVWIDAVCINQQDHDEKARVVPQMGDIYTRAAEVLVWLGPEQDRSNVAMDLLSWMWFPQERDRIQHMLCTAENRLEVAHLTAMFSALLNGEHIHHAADDTVRLGLPPPGNVVWSALPALYRRDWFSRVWTFQEIMLASKATVLCGDRAIPWAVFQQLGDRLADTQLLWVDQPGGQETFSPMRDLTNPHRDGEWFWLYLRGARDRFCKFKEDRIYGMLALAPESIRSSLPVVYGEENDQNYVRVYRDATALFFRELGLEVVLVAAIGCGQTKEVPSWCPDWSLRTLSTPAPARFKADSAHLTLQDWSLDGNDKNVLHVRGLRVDVVKEVIDDYTYHWPNGVSGIDGPADKMLQWLNKCEAMSRRALQSPDRAGEALWKTLVSHSDIRNQGNFPPDPVRGLAAHRKRLAENRDSIPFSQTALTTDDIQALGPYLAYVGVLWPGKVFFCTEGGTIGLADKGVASGDEICMLFGTCRYFALRAKGKDMHSLESVAYVHGLMNDVGSTSLEKGARMFHLM